MLSSSSSGTVFTGDNDPELVGEALPFALKLQESILASIPNHDGLRLGTGRLYVMYAKAHDLAEKAGYTIVRNYVGEYCTSLEMAGASLTILRVDDEIEALLDAPAETAARIF